MTDIIDGKALATTLRQEIAKQVTDLQQQHGITVGLAVILVGEDPASQVYVDNKRKQSQAAGFHSEVHRLPSDTSESELLALIEGLNADKRIHGILVQLPLPPHIDTQKVINAVATEKDVDGFSLLNVGRLHTGQAGLVPCTPLGCMMLLKRYFNEDLSGKHAVVLGRSNIVGKPMAELLLQANCTVTLVHSHTQHIEAITQRADILVVAIGRANTVKKSWLGEQTVVIDVGINRIEHEGQSHLVGDVDFDSVQGTAKAITPVPGGVGPMTIACLLYNTLTACQRQMGLEDGDAVPR